MKASITSRASALAVMALAAAAGGMTANVSRASETSPGRYDFNNFKAQNQPIERNKAPGMPSLASLFRAGIGSGSRGSERRSGPGWTNAHAKRVAVKARNVRRHRAANR